MEAVTLWALLTVAITRYYPKVEGSGRWPIGLERMLRMYVAQKCFGLLDQRIEDSAYDNQAIRRFVGIDLAPEPAPNATTLLNFRRLLNELEPAHYFALYWHRGRNSFKIIDVASRTRGSIEVIPLHTSQRACARDVTV